MLEEAEDGGETSSVVGEDPRDTAGQSEEKGGRKGETRLPGLSCGPGPVQLCIEVLTALYPGTKVQLKPKNNKVCIQRDGEQ